MAILPLVDGFALEFLTLLESGVTHREFVQSEGDRLTGFHKTDVDVSYMTPKIGRLTSYVTVKHVVTINDIDVQQTTVRYSAQFRQMGSVRPDELVRFALVRAPELIFPFIRQTVALQTASSSFGTVLLNEVDFVEICRRKMPEN